MPGKSREPGRSTTDRLLSILDAFGPGATERRLVDLADAARLPKATTLRLVRELVAWGTLERSPSGTYRVGARLWQLGRLWEGSGVLREIALPFMEDLFRASRENVQLAVLQGRGALVVERIYGAESVLTRTKVGSHLPLHASGVGKVLLAFADRSVQLSILESDLPPFTPKTITDPTRLMTQLQRVRAQSVAYVFEEFTVSAISVAVPISDARGDVRAALSLVTHAGSSPYRHTAALRTAAYGIGRSLA